MAPSHLDRQLKHGVGRHPVIPLKPRRVRAAPLLRIWIFAFVWLTLITLLAASASFKGIFPIDSRVNRFSDDITAAFETRFSATAIEPFSALASIIVGAPDYKLA